MTRQRDPELVRGWVALILATVVGLGVLMLTAAALYDAVADPTQAGISPEYAALVQTTLGVLVGGLVGYLGGTQYEREKEHRHRQHAQGDTLPAPDTGYGDDGSLP